MGNGSLIDSNNSDATFAKIHSVMGEKQGLTRAFNPEYLMEEFKMIGDNSDRNIEE